MDREFVRNRFASIRLARNISARALSIKLGQSTAYISQIENGRRLPSLEVLFSFCEFFGLTLQEFFDDGKYHPVQYKDLFRILNKLDPEELFEVTTITKRIASFK